MCLGGTGTNWDVLLCDVGLSVYLLIMVAWIFIFGVGVSSKEAGAVIFRYGLEGWYLEAGRGFRRKTTAHRRLV